MIFTLKVKECDKTFGRDASIIFPKLKFILRASCHYCSHTLIKYVTGTSLIFKYMSIDHTHLNNYQDFILNSTALQTLIIINTRGVVNQTTRNLRHDDQTGSFYLPAYFLNKLIFIHSAAYKERRW